MELVFAYKTEKHWRRGTSASGGGKSIMFTLQGRLWRCRLWCVQKTIQIPSSQLWTKLRVGHPSGLMDWAWKRCSSHDTKLSAIFKDMHILRHVLLSWKGSTCLTSCFCPCWDVRVLVWSSGPDPDNFCRSHTVHSHQLLCWNSSDSTIDCSFCRHPAKRRHRQGRRAEDTASSQLFNRCVPELSIRWNWSMWRPWVIARWAVWSTTRRLWRSRICGHQCTVFFKE